jgi:hypothetical protein
MDALESVHPLNKVTFHFTPCLPRSKFMKEWIMLSFLEQLHRVKRVDERRCEKWLAVPLYEVCALRPRICYIYNIAEKASTVFSTSSLHDTNRIFNSSSTIPHRLIATHISMSTTTKSSSKGCGRILVAHLLRVPTPAKPIRTRQFWLQWGVGGGLQ